MMPCDLSLLADFMSMRDISSESSPDSNIPARKCRSSCDMLHGEEHVVERKPRGWGILRWWI